MLSHIVNDLYGAYITEVIEPKIGGDKSEKSDSPTPSGGTPDEQAAKRIRQAVYDIRYRARREDIGIDQAYNQYMSHTSMNAMEKTAVREKLGLGSGGSTAPVKEENLPEAKKYLRVDPSKRNTGEKVYYKTYDPSNPKDIAKRHSLETKGIKTTATQYVPKSGLPYDNQNAGEKYEKKYGSASGKNTVGDRDRDGKVEPDRHEYAGVKDRAIKNAMASQQKPKAKKASVKEGFSDWRNDLCEVIDKLDTDLSDKKKQIKEKTINNKIDINPTINVEQFSDDSGIQLIESFELNEEQVQNVINSATEYFYESGLNENGIDILIENVGIDNFVEYVFEISSEKYLEEKVNVKSLSGSARKKAGVKSAHLSKTGKELKGSVREKSISAVRSARAERKSGPEQTERQKTLARLQSAQRERNIAKAKESQTNTKSTPQKTKKGILDRVAGAVLKGIERHKAATSAASSSFKKGMERHNQATATASRLAKETGETAKKAGKIAGHVASSAAGGASKVAKDIKKVVTKEESEVEEALDTWHPETTTDTSDQNKKVQAKIKEKKKKVTVPSYLPPLTALTKKQSINKESTEIVEVAPPGAKFERMVKHIKKSLKGNKRSKEIAYATAWKQYGKQQKEEVVIEDMMDNSSELAQNKVSTTPDKKDIKSTQNNAQMKKMRTIQKSILQARMRALNAGVGA